VALEHHGREAIVPAPAHCLTRAGAGPGTPFADDATPAFRAALERFDFEPGAAAPALAVLLAQPRREDALTFWHLLARVAPAERGRVFDALAAVHPAPAGVTRAGIVGGDAAMRRAWAVGLGFGALLKN
jgi:hypothetical protein